jgi:hypothetical protein
MRRLWRLVGEEAVLVAEEWRRRADEAVEREERERRVCEELEAVRLAEEEEQKKYRGYEAMDHLYAMWKEVVGIGPTAPTEDKASPSNPQRGTTVAASSASVSGDPADSKVSVYFQQIKQKNLLAPTTPGDDPYSLEQFMSKYEDMSTGAAVEAMTDDRQKFMQMIAEYEKASATAATCAIQLDTVDRSRQESTEAFPAPPSSDYKKKGNIFFDGWMEEEFNFTSEKKPAEPKKRSHSSSSSSSSSRSVRNTQTEVDEHSLRCGRCSLNPCQCPREVHSLFIPTTRPAHTANTATATDAATVTNKTPVPQQQQQQQQEELVPVSHSVGEAKVEMYDDYDSELQRFFDKIEARKNKSKESSRHKSKSKASSVSADTVSASLSLAPSVSSKHKTQTPSKRHQQQHQQQQQASSEQPHRKESEHESGRESATTKRSHRKSSRSEHIIVRAPKQVSSSADVTAPSAMSTSSRQSEQQQWGRLQVDRYFDERLQLLESLQADHLLGDFASGQHQDPPLQEHRSDDPSDAHSLRQSHSHRQGSSGQGTHDQRAEWQASLDGYFGGASSRAAGAETEAHSERSRSSGHRAGHEEGVERLKASLKEQRAERRGEQHGGGWREGDSWHEGWGEEGEEGDFPDMSGAHYDQREQEDMYATRTSSSSSKRRGRPQSNRENGAEDEGGAYYATEDYLYDFTFDMCATRNSASFSSSGPPSASKRPKSATRHRPKSASGGSATKKKIQRPPHQRGDGPAIRY